MVTPVIGCGRLERLVPLVAVQLPEAHAAQRRNFLISKVRLHRFCEQCKFLFGQSVEEVEQRQDAVSLVRRHRGQDRHEQAKAVVVVV